MKKRKNILATTVLAILTMSLLLPLTIQPASAQTPTEPEVLPYRDKWLWIKTDQINIIFPAGGKKPMFLWWYADDTSNIYVVKYKGLIEFLTFDQPFYKRVYEATELRLHEILDERYFGPKKHLLSAAIRLRIQQRLLQLASWYGLHRPYLPFGACQWNLTGPTEVTRGDVQYLSFNFTLTKVPSLFPNLKFAENNVIIRCRFYYTDATEKVDDLYTYTVDAGELKMDLIVKNWTWNIDLIKPLLEELSEHDIEVPLRKAGLALWINLATIPIEKIDLAEEDIETTDANVEASSTASTMYVEGASVSVVQNKTLTEQEQPMTARLRERFKLRFEKGNATLAGFFKFVPKAIIRDGENATLIDVKASYIPAGHHMRLFLCYPYFGNKTLEHDPSLGLETIPTFITPQLILLLVGIASMIAIVIGVVKWKKRIINVVGVS